MRARFLVACLGVGLVVAGAGRVFSADAQKIPWLESPAEAFRLARESGRPCLVYLSSPSCGFCRKMERETLIHSTVIHRVTGDFVALRVNGEQNPEWLDHYQIQAFPALVILSGSGEPLLRVEGYQSPRKLLRNLDAALQPR